LIFSRWIASGGKKPTDEASYKKKLWTLRTINFILIALELIAVFETQYIRQISLTGLTLLLAFIIVHVLQIFLLYNFGRTREFDGETWRSETYQSEVFGLLAIILAFIISVLVIINIWGMTDWLQATSVLGALLLLVYSTKEIWVADNINGLMLLYNGDVEPGSVIRVDTYNLLAIAVETTLTQTIFRDLRSRHRIVLPNSKLRACKIDILSKGPSSGLRQFADFNLGYGLASETVIAFLLDVLAEASAAESAINAEKTGSVKLLEAGDHAVTWRLSYSLKNIYRLIDAQCAINKAAYDLSLARNIGLNTPLTHTIDIQKNSDLAQST
jgi:hypothetical protein